MSDTAARAFARAASAIVHDYDVTGVLDALLTDAQLALSAGAIGLLVSDDDGGYELLSSTSHRSAELDLYQAQLRSGPWGETVRSGTLVSEHGAGPILARWPAVGPRVVAAGFAAVQAYPLRWHGKTIGALNVLLTDAGDVADHVLGQAFADIATLVILRTEPLLAAEVVRRTESALAGRTVIEQAKGVLAHQRGLDADEAFEARRRIAEPGRLTLSDAAEQVVRGAAAPLPNPTH
ncbi:MAG: GAF and ANTAR domain-containing protein [Terracoccus sp.]